MKKLLFITTSSLASNPRLVKEFETLKTHYYCVVISFVHNDWSFELSEVIKTRNPEVQFIDIDRTSAFKQTIFCKIINRVAVRLNSFFKNHFATCSFANNDKALQLLFTSIKLEKIHKFNRVIAHNLGAFYAGVKFSNRNKCFLQLDIEDYYPGEALYSNKSNEINNRLRIMEFSFLKADAISYASKGIQIECEKRFKIKQDSKHEIILNFFNSSDFLEPVSQKNARVQCVWFSQYIGPKRGLEVIFTAARELPHIDFNLIGKCKSEYIESIDLSSNILIHPTMNQEALHSFLGKMDIGLALEEVSVDLNRNICLTNKLLTYLQTGLYVLATNTFGQQQFLSSLEHTAGSVMSATLAYTLKNFDYKLLATDLKIERWKHAKCHSWDIEKTKLFSLLDVSTS